MYFSALVTAPLIVPGLFLAVALLSFYDEIDMRRSLTTVMIGTRARQRCRLSS
jgi:ABC-type spermidine/putrescine transport system permease subunit II